MNRPKDEKEKLAACYVKKDTWQDSMLAAREALAKLDRPNPITQTLEEEKRNEAEG